MNTWWCWQQFWQDCSEHIEFCTDSELYSNQDDFRPEHWQPQGQLHVSDVLGVAKDPGHEQIKPCRHQGS